MASIHLATARKTVTDLLPQAPKEFHGIVVSAGLMDKTVKVKLGGQRWEKRISKVSFISCSQAAAFHPLRPRRFLEKHKLP